MRASIASWSRTGALLGLGGLELLHHLELDVLELADAAGEGDQLLLQVLEVLGVGDQTLVHAVLVALAARLDLLDVGVGLLLLAGQVVDLDLRVTGLPVELVALGGQRLELGVLGEGGSRCRSGVEP